MLSLKLYLYCAVVAFANVTSGSSVLQTAYTNSTRILGTSVTSASLSLHTSAPLSLNTSAKLSLNTSTPLLSNVSACDTVADCYIGPPALTFVVWVSVVYKTTITAGTVYYVTQNGTNSTRFSTSHAATYNSTSTAHATAYNSTGTNSTINAAGTAITTINVGPSDIVLTYPSSWVRYDTTYGKITKQLNATGCKSSLNVTLASSLDYPHASLPGAVIWATPSPEDKFGTDWRARVVIAQIEEDWARSAYPSDGDFMTCKAVAWDYQLIAPPRVLTEYSTIGAATVYATQTCDEPCGATTVQGQPASPVTMTSNIATSTIAPTRVLVPQSSTVLDSQSSVADSTSPSTAASIPVAESESETNPSAASTASILQNTILGINPSTDSSTEPLLPSSQTQDLKPLLSVIASIVSQTSVAEAISTVPTVPTALLYKPSAIVVTAGDATLTATAVSGGYVIAGQTIVPGSTGITVSGTTISLPASGSNIVINQATYTYAPTSPSEATDSITLGTEQVAYSSITGASSGIVVAGQTIAVGSTITISGHTVALPAASNIVVDGTTSPLPLPSAPLASTGILAADGDALSFSVASRDSGIVIAGQTIAPGSAITASGHVVALPLSGTVVVIDGSTAVLPVQTQAANLNVLTVGGGTLSYSILPSSAGVMIAGQTVAFGSTITASGHTIALPTSGSAIVVDGTTSTLPSEPAQTSQSAVLTIGTTNLAFSVLPSSTGIIIAGQTLTPGSTITAAGHTIALPATGSAIIIDGTTSTPPTQTTTQAAQTGELTIGTQTLPFTLLPSSSGILIGTQTLIPGSTITASGHTIALPSSGSSIIIDGTTSVLSAALSSPSKTGILILTTPSQTGLLTLGSQTVAYSLLPSLSSLSGDGGEGKGNGGVVIAGQTLVPGSVITVEGETLSLLSTSLPGDGTVTEVVVLGTEMAATSTQGLGGIGSASASAAETGAGSGRTSVAVTGTGSAAGEGTASASAGSGGVAGKPLSRGGTWAVVLGLLYVFHMV